MRVFSVGKDEFLERQLELLNNEQIDYIVYSYSYGMYEGNGIAIIKDIEGNFYTMDLSHCSCYGPTENGFSGGTRPSVPTNLDTILNSDDIHDEYLNEDMINKIKELENVT